MKTGDCIAIVLYQNETGTSSTDSFWSEALELLLTRLHHRKLERIETRLPQFHVFDGSSRIAVEAESEEDAHYLCSEMGWELICTCED
jgi:hypothetical protein